VKTLVLLLALTLLAIGAASAGLTSWQIKCGLGDNVYPYGNDFSTRFGVDPAGTWDYDGRDAVHPPVGDATHDLAFIYDKDYYKVYRDKIPHDVGAFHWDAPVGWPPPWGNHGGGAAPNYPNPGLLKDTRAPILAAGQPEFWQVKAYAPLGLFNPDISDATCSFIWSLNMEPGFEIPDNMVVQLWGNSDLESVSIFGDLILFEKGMAAGEYKIPGIPQWGMTDDSGEFALKHTWIIQATIIPEPAVAQLAGLVFGIAGLGIARFRRK
jgi:hypothetical protein